MRKMRKRADLYTDVVYDVLGGVQDNLYDAITALNNLFDYLYGDDDEERYPLIDAIDYWVEELHKVNSHVGDMIENREV